MRGEGRAAAPHSATSDPVGHGLLPAATGCLLLALGALALVRGPLLYDGSFFLYQVLQTGAPFIPDNRFVAVPIHLLTLAMAHWTDETWTIALIFSAMYIALAAGSFLGAAWWISRRDPQLMAWPVLGLLAVSPILVDSTTESLVTAGLAFPLVYLAATAKTPPRVIGAAIVAAVLFVSHPAAGLVLLVAGGAAAYRWESSARRDHVELAYCAVALGVGVLRLRLLVPGYETQIASPGTFLKALSAGIGPTVAVMILAVWLTGALLLVTRRGLVGFGVGRWLPLLPLAATLPTVASLLFGGGWPPALDYRLATVPVVLPLLVLLAIEATGDTAPAPAGDSAHTSDPVYRRTGALAMIAVSLIVGVQAWRWQGEVSAMRAYVAAAPGPCVPDVSARNRAIAHWGGRSLAVIIQGRHPTVVLGSAADCRRLRAQHLYSGSTKFVALYPTESGWFHLPSP